MIQILVLTLLSLAAGIVSAGVLIPILDGERAPNTIDRLARRIIGAR